MAEAAKGVGKPKIGGHFALLDQEGKTFTDKDMKGGYSLVSVSNGFYGRTRLIDLFCLGLLRLLSLPRHLP